MIPKPGDVIRYRIGKSVRRMLVTGWEDGSPVGEIILRRRNRMSGVIARPVGAWEIETSNTERGTKAGMVAQSPKGRPCKGHERDAPVAGTIAETGDLPSVP